MNITGKLFVSYLLVMFFSAGSLVAVTLAVSPRAIERHMLFMENQSAQDLASESMQSNLQAAFGSAITQSLSWGLSVGIVTVILMGMIVSRQLVRPLKEMEIIAKQFASGNYERRLSTALPAELGNVAFAINQMADAIDETEKQRLELIGVVSHEFRTPLTSMTAHVEAMVDGVLEWDKETQHVFETQLSRLNRLVEDLSLLSRIEAGQERIEIKATDLAEFLHVIEGAMKLEFQKRKVTLRFDKSPNFKVLIDSERTAQVLTNLMNNALRHTHQGGLVEVRCEQKQKAVTLTVKDNGEGIAAEALPHVFKRFYRGDTSRRNADDSSSGLGLTISQYFVAAQGGVMGVRSQEGAGSEFWFTVPLTTQESLATSP